MIKKEDKKEIEEIKKEFNSFRKELSEDIFWKELPRMIYYYGRNKMKALQQQREETNKRIQARLDYCKKANGLSHCKNCGLNEDDLKQ